MNAALRLASLNGWKKNSSRGKKKKVKEMERVGVLLAARLSFVRSMGRWPAHNPPKRKPAQPLRQQTIKWSRGRIIWLVLLLACRGRLAPLVRWIELLSFMPRLFCLISLSFHQSKTNRSLHFSTSIPFPFTRCLFVNSIHFSISFQRLIEFPRQLRQPSLINSTIDFILIHQLFHYSLSPSLKLPPVMLLYHSCC